MEYKATRTKDLLVYHYRNLDIRCTRDENDSSVVWLDICYTGTDIGLGYFTGRNTEFTTLLNQAEAFCAGYNRAMADYKVKPIKRK